MSENEQIIIEMLKEILDRLPEKPRPRAEEKWEEVSNASLSEIGFKVSRSMTAPTSFGKHSVSVWAVRDFPKVKGINGLLKAIPGAKWFANEWRFYYDPSQKLLELEIPRSGAITPQKGN